MARVKQAAPVKVAGNSYYLPAMSNAALFKGYMTEDGVFYSGDALYPREIWSRYKLPYSIDPYLAENLC